MRPIAGPEELDLFCQLPYVLNDELASDLEDGRRRPEWMWVATRRDRVVARAAWWGRHQDGEPFLLDIFDIVDDPEDSRRIESGVRLLESAFAQTLRPGVRRPEYIRFVPPDWRDDPMSRRVVEDRMVALERTGARLFVERLRLEWRSGTPVPEPSTRLAFRPVAGREELVDLMAQVLEGTLDAHSRQDLGRMSAERTAAGQYDEEFVSYPSPRDWWRIATTPDGEPVGFVIPARNAYNPILAYIGVLPAHRGNGYVDEILAEGTRILAAHDAPRIRASTDLDNVPMARAFDRAGYVNFERQIDMIWP